MEKEITIGNKKIRMRASALIPRLYRVKIGRDLLTDVQKLQKSLSSIKEKTDKGENAEFGIEDLCVFEDIAYVMAYAADPTIEKTPEEWLDHMEGTFSIYEVLPEILELWATSNKTTSSPFQSS